MVRAVAPDPATHERQVQQTRQSLDTIDDTSLVSLSDLGIPEVQAIKQEIAEIFPASNLPAFLLQGLLQLNDRTLSPARIHADLTVLFRGTREIGLFGTFLAAPALVIYGYQKMLMLAGKDVESAFPDGIWQFYTEFGLREDTARHTVETVGFCQTHPTASDIDALTSWVYTAIQVLFVYDDLLANEWHERIIVRCLDDALEAHAIQVMGRKLPRKREQREQAIAAHVMQLRQKYRVEHIAMNWAAQRPFNTPSGDLPETYAAYRRQRFQAHLDKALRYLPRALRNDMAQRYAHRVEHDLPAYQQQMTILMSLRPELYQEHHDQLSLEQAHIAIAIGGNYYLLDVCARDTNDHLLVFPSDATAQSAGVALPLTQSDDQRLYDRYGQLVTITRTGVVAVNDQILGYVRPPSIATVKSQIRALLKEVRPMSAATEVATPPLDMLLAQAPRVRQHELRDRLNATTRAALHDLSRAPIIINWDQHNGALALRDIRWTQRGCGDHALTLVHTDRSMVFDMSHIFFDGIWGMALAELMTGFAQSLFTPVAAERPKPAMMVTALPLADNPSFRKAAGAAIATSPIEVSAETTAIDLTAMLTLRRRLDKLKVELTINDLLLLTRAIHAASYDPYRPGGRAQAALTALSRLDDGADLRREIEKYSAEERAFNPVLLIPMDASAVDPRRRLFPATFRNPVPDMLPRLYHCATMVHNLRQREDDALLREFEAERRLLYNELRTFSALLQSLKDVTRRGESFTVAALRLLAYLPRPMQHLMSLIPQKIDILNEIIKGREVFSNVGQVALARR